MRVVLLHRFGPREAALLSLLAYAGLRPGEALTLSWDAIGERTVLVEHGRDDGGVKATKTNRIRTVGLLAPVAEDIATWRRVTPATGPHDLLFPRPDGDVFRDTDYRNWRTRRFDPTATAAGATPATLRHSFASLLVQAGWTRWRSRSRWATLRRSSNATTPILPPLPRIRAGRTNRSGGNHPRLAQQRTHVIPLVEFATLPAAFQAASCG